MYYLKKVKFTILDKKIFKKKTIKKIMAKNAITTSGLTFLSFQNYYGKSNLKEEFGDYEENILDETEYDIINRAYMGGITNFNLLNMERKGTILSIDINSSYPYQMTQELPYGEPLHKYKKGCIGFVSVNIKAFKIKEEFRNKIPPFFPRWKTEFRLENTGFYPLKKRYIYDYKYEYGEFNACFTIDEWAYYKKYYEFNAKIVKKFWFQKKPLIKKYIDALKDIKNQAKDPGERNLGKLLMNGLYGKLAQKPIGERYIEIDVKKKNKILPKLEKLKEMFSYIDYKNEIIYGISENKIRDLIEILENPKIVFEKEFSLHYLLEWGANSIFSFDK